MQHRSPAHAALGAVPPIKIQAGCSGSRRISSAREAGADHRDVGHGEIEPDRRARRAGLQGGGHRCWVVQAVAGWPPAVA